MFTYFTGFKGSRKATLSNTKSKDEIFCNIGTVVNHQSTYIGGYKALDGVVMLENIIGYDTSFYRVRREQAFLSIADTEESIYKCVVSNKIKIGSIEEKEYLIATLYDLMVSLTEPLQGFTVSKDLEGNYYLLICNQGEYIMNPNYNKDIQDV